MAKGKLIALGWFGLGLAALPAFLLIGCGQRQGTYLGDRDTSLMGNLSEEQLTERLESYANKTKELLFQTSQTLSALDPNLGTRRTDVVRNLRLTHAMNIMLDLKEPIAAFLETWVLAIRIKDYFKTGYGRNLYGEHQAIVVDAAERLEISVERIGREMLSEQEFEETQKEVQNFASRYPISETLSNLVIYATEARTGEPSPFREVLSLPLAPFTAMKGVDRTASAIYGVKDSVKRAADVVEELPESARWQLLLLLDDMENASIVKSFLTSASTFSQSSTRLVDTAEGLPVKLREQASILVKDIDDSQANLQQTLDKTKETAAALDHSLAVARNTVEALERTANVVTATAEQWQLAATATNAVITSVKQWRGGTPKKVPGQSTTIQDYQETIHEVTQATNELQILIAGVNDLVESEALTTRISDVRNNTEVLVDHVTWRMIQLIGMIAVTALGFKFLSMRIINKCPR